MTSLTATLDELLPSDSPELATPEWVAQTFGLAAKATVIQAIRSGKLPALRVASPGRRGAYAIRPADAALIWGHRLRRTDPAAKSA